MSDPEVPVALFLTIALGNDGQGSLLGLSHAERSKTSPELLQASGVSSLIRSVVLREIFFGVLIVRTSSGRTTEQNTPRKASPLLGLCDK
jgi:hypothetical protein